MDNTTARPFPLLILLSLFNSLLFITSRGSEMIPLEAVAIIFWLPGLILGFLPFNKELRRKNLYTVLAIDFIALCLTTINVMVVHERGYWEFLMVLISSFSIVLGCFVGLGASTLIVKFFPSFFPYIFYKLSIPIIWGIILVLSLGDLLLTGIRLTEYGIGFGPMRIASSNLTNDLAFPLLSLISIALFLFWIRKGGNNYFSILEKEHEIEVE